MARTRVPKCPNCNVDLVEAGEFPVELFWLGQIDPTPRLYVCQNPDEICGHFTIFGHKPKISGHLAIDA